MKVKLTSKFLVLIQGFSGWNMAFLPDEEHSSLRLIRLNKDNREHFLVSFDSESWQSIPNLPMTLKQSPIQVHLSPFLLDSITKHINWDIELVNPSLERTPEISQFAQGEIKIPGKLIRFIRAKEKVAAESIDKGEFSDKTVENLSSFDGTTWISSDQPIPKIGFEEKKQKAEELLVATEQERPQTLTPAAAQVGITERHSHFAKPSGIAKRSSEEELPCITDEKPRDKYLRTSTPT